MTLRLLMFFILALFADRANAQAVDCQRLAQDMQSGQYSPNQMRAMQMVHKKECSQQSEIDDQKSEIGGGTVCYNSKVAVEIADLEMQVLDGQVNEGPNFDTRPYDQRIANLVEKNCVRVENYPAQRGSAVMKWNCQVLRGDLQTSDGKQKPVYWTRCPEAKE